MDIKVKKLADSGELKELKYIFVDSLDVDPTFVRYEEDYNYCKSMPGLLEKHIELTPFSYNEKDWNEAYWIKLKMDLIKNFSDERMTHMRLVAKTFLAEKIERILRERNNIESKKTVINAEPSLGATTSSTSVVTTSYPSKHEQEREQEKVRQDLERENREFEAQQEAERRRREELRRRMAAQNNNSRIYRSRNNTNNISKKVIGIAVAAVAVTLTAVAMYMLLK